MHISFENVARFCESFWFEVIYFKVPKQVKFCVILKNFHQCISWASSNPSTLERMKDLPSKNCLKLLLLQLPVLTNSRMGTENGKWHTMFYISTCINSVLTAQYARAAIVTCICVECRMCFVMKTEPFPETTSYPCSCY